MRRLLLLLGTLALAGCLNNNDAGDGTPSDPATETFASNLHIDIASMTKTAAGDYYKDVVGGTGGTIVAPVEVVITYAGFLTNGASFDAGTSIMLNLAGSVFGFQDAMLGMRVGGERVMVIPSALGYGQNQVGVVPPNSTLIFDVKLEQIP
jgi:FKBP-type peptidyl-prolyl cis-trans isomerase